MYVFGFEKLQCLPKALAMLMHHLLVVGSRLKGKDINEYTLTEGLEAITGPYRSGIGTPELCMASVIVGVAVCCLKEIGRLETLIAYLAHAVKILARHNKVYIIVPRNETLVADRSQQRATFYPTPQVVLLAVG